SITLASCESLSALKSAFPPTPHRLNAYYVERVQSTEIIGGVPYTFDVSGKWCPNDPNIVLLGSVHLETLAHEVGHAFSLQHTDGLLPVTNLMFSQSIPRDSLTTGQAF